MATLAEDMATYFIANNVIAGFGVDFFSDCLPDKPDSILAIYEYAGDPPMPYINLIQRSIQILSRDVNADLAKSKIMKAYNSLYTTREDLLVQFTSNRFGQVYVRQTPFKLKEDENNRVIYCFNIGITTTID